MQESTAHQRRSCCRVNGTEERFALTCQFRHATASGARSWRPFVLWQRLALIRAQLRGNRRFAPEHCLHLRLTRPAPFSQRVACSSSAYHQMRGHVWTAELTICEASLSCMASRSFVPSLASSDNSLCASLGALSTVPEVRAIPCSPSSGASLPSNSSIVEESDSIV
jgi:hypothetical protein